MSAPSVHTQETDTGHPDRPWAIVTAREMVVKLTDRGFLISTILISVLIIAAIAISGFVNSRASEDTIAVTGDTGSSIIADAHDDGGQSKLSSRTYASATKARQAVAGGTVDGALIHESGEWTLIQDDEIDTALDQTLRTAVRDATIAHNAKEAGTSLAQLARGSTLHTDVVNPGNEQSDTAMAVGFVFALLFYMSAIIFGMAIANSVLEEKQNRIVEILAAAIPVRQLLYGKVLGNCLLAFGQIVLYGVLALIAINFTDLTVDVAWLASASGWFIAFFAAGFMALAAIWAVLGAMASRSEDLQSSTTPVIGLLVAILFVGMWAKGLVLAIASYIPIASTVAMPVRLLQDDIGLWQPVLSLGITVVAAYLLVRLAERIYVRAVMQTGPALSWRQALKLET